MTWLNASTSSVGTSGPPRINRCIRNWTSGRPGMGCFYRLNRWVNLIKNLSRDAAGDGGNWGLALKPTKSLKAKRSFIG